MRHYIVCLRDIVANVYHPPMFAANLGTAIRSFGDACQNKPEGNLVGQHPDDYELYHVGYWDDGNCEFHVEGDNVDGEDGDDITVAPKQIAIGRNYKQK